MGVMKKADKFQPSIFVHQKYFNSQCKQVYSQLQYIVNILRMNECRNILYEIKKDSQKRSSPLYIPNHEQDDLRQQLTQLRTLLRSKDTQIIRLKSQIDDLRNKISVYQINHQSSMQTEQENQQNQKSIFSQIPMIMENKDLKQTNGILNEENLQLNGKNNILEAQLRQLKSDMMRTQTKLKELTILEQMRQERFKDELQKLTPIIVEDNKDFVFIRDGMVKLVNFLRDGVFRVVFQIFLRCAKQCEKEKKISSFTIFRNYWSDIKASKNLGFLSAVKAYQAVKKVTKMLEENYADLNEQSSRDTMNEWVINTIIDIKNSKAKEADQKLFRFLGLYYRSKFPIKGENFELDADLKPYFEDLICQQIRYQLSQP